MAAVRVTLSSPHPFAGAGPIGAGLSLTGRVQATIDDPGFAWQVELVLVAHEGRLAPESVSVRQRPGGAPVGTDTLRDVPVGAYVRRARDEMRAHPGMVMEYLGSGRTATVGRTVMPDGRPMGAPGAKVQIIPAGTVVEHFSPASPARWAAMEAAQRQHRPTQETLPEVAAAYREALEDPTTARAPTAHVGRKLNYSRGHAAKLVGLAREAGLLGPALGTKAGESSKKTRKGDKGRNR